MNNLSKKSLFLSLLLLASLGLAVSACVKKPAIPAVNQNQNTNTATTTSEIDTSDWNTYSLGISTYYFKYPSSLFVVRNNAFNVTLLKSGTDQSQIVISLGPGADKASILDEEYAAQEAMMHCMLRGQAITINCQQIISNEPIVINGIYGYRVVLSKKIERGVDEQTLDKTSTPYYSLDLVNASGDHIIMSVWSNPELFELFNDESTTNDSYMSQMIDKIVSTIGS